MRKITPPIPDDPEYPNCPECGTGRLYPFLGFEYDWNVTPWVKCSSCGLKTRASTLSKMVHIKAREIQASLYATVDELE